MTPEDSNPDFLENALQRSREAIPDAGFSLAVERRVLVRRRRRKFVRLLPVLMAIVGTAVAAALGGFSIPALVSSFDLGIATSFLAALGPIVTLLATLGVPPLLGCAGLLVLFVALAANRRDPPLLARL